MLFREGVGVFLVREHKFVSVEFCHCGMHLIRVVRNFCAMPIPDFLQGIAG